VHPLGVRCIERLTEDAVVIAFAVPEELREAYRFHPGQHVVVLHNHEGDVVRRSYSICSSATSGELQIGVKELPGGAFSPFAVRRLKEGDILHVMVPSGSFGPRFDPEQARHYGAVAAGSGITPILSILATALDVEPRSRASLLYGNRSLASAMFRRELDALRERHGARLAVTYALSRERAPGAVEGRIRAERLEALLPVGAIDDWYLCGPEQLVDDATTALRTAGVDSERMHRELFHSDAETEVDLAGRPDLWSEVRVRVEGIETTMTLHSRGEPILTAAMANRADMPYACREAICATCRAKVVEGTVVMDRCSALDRLELESGYVLTCQAHPVDPVVTVDFDA
jgi:ring-1,2-phenylacetyl-CoA epoxidase subunit PaaE